MPEDTSPDHHQPGQSAGDTPTPQADTPASGYSEPRAAGETNLRTAPKATREGRRARSRAIMRQFIRFGLVGASGFVVNQAVFIIFKKLFEASFAVDDLEVLFQLLNTQWNVRWYHLFSVLAFVVANIWNFALNRYWTFKGQQKQPWWIQLPQFMAVGAFGLLITLAVSTLLVHQGSPIGLPEDIFDNSTGLRTRSYWGNFIGVIVAVPANFLFNKLWTFRNRDPQAPASTAAGAHATSSAATSSTATGTLAAGTPGQGLLPAAGGASSRKGNMTQKLWESQLVRFVLVGGFSGVVDLGSTLLLRFTLDMSDTGSKAIGFTLGTLTAYMINRRWTFNAAPSTKRFLITMATYLLTFLVQVGLYRVTIPWLEGFELNAFWVRVLSFVVAQGVATILNFLIQRFVIFRVREDAEA